MHEKSRCKTSARRERKLLSTILSAVLVVSLCPGPSYASDGGPAVRKGGLSAGLPSFLSALASTVVKSGDCGTCSWTIGNDGQLTISPVNGASGTMEPLGALGDAPWSTYREFVTTVKVKQGVKAGASLSYAFSALENLKSVDLSGFDTSQTTNMHGMFLDCPKLESVDLAGLDLSKVTHLSELFSGCESLASVDLSGIDTANAVDMSGMFLGCSSLDFLEASALDMARVETTSRMFEGCSSLASLDLSKNDTSNVRNMYGMFLNCPSLTSLNLAGVNTSSVDDMMFMFSGCSSLKSLDVSGFDTANVTDMTSMFSGCTGLESIKLAGIDTSNVVHMDGMFSSCSSLKSLDLSGLDTGKVTGMSSMFENCSALEELSLSGSFNTSKAKSMNGMFAFCSSLPSLDLSKFDTRQVEDMTLMFSGCESLASLDLSGFRTPNLWNVDSMFWGCKELEQIDLSQLDFSKVTVTNSMFFACSALERVHLPGSWTTQNLDMGWMFYGCVKLKTISVPDSNVDLRSVGQGSSVFSNCLVLNGGNGTSFKASNVDGLSYARVDGEGGLPGYFTVIPGHDHSAGVPAREGEVPANCLEDGSYDLVARCTVCDDVLSREHFVIPALGHDWDEGAITVEPTCGTAGVKTFTCRNDASHTRTEEVAALGHSLVAVAEVPATCEEPGTAAHWRCERCGDLFSDVAGKVPVASSELAIPAKGHDWDGGAVTTVPTCGKPGTLTFTCKNDASHTRAEEIAALGHDWGVWAASAPATCEQPGTERRTCSRDASHYEEREISALGHDWDGGAVTMAPTCTEKGVRTYTCKNDASHTRAEEIAATGHNASAPVRENESAATCTKAGSYDLVTRCANCGEVLSSERAETPALGHSWGAWKTVKQATYTATGKQQRTCARCGEVESRAIAKLLRPISSTKVSVGALTYKGRALTPSVAVTLSGKKLKAGTDYTLKYYNAKGKAITVSKIVAVGSYFVTVTGKGSYKGSVKKAFKVNKAKIASASFSKVKSQKLVKKGKAVTPKPTVKFSGKKLKTGVDYTLTYKNNKKVGTASVIVKGKGNFTGTKTIKFKIVAK